MTTPAQLKDKLDSKAIGYLATVLQRTWTGFEKQAFIQVCCTDLDMLELKQRVQHIIHGLSRYLPDNYTTTSDILVAAGRLIKTENDTAAWQDYAVWPLIDYVGHYGQKDIATSMAVLEVLTPLFTAEFAIRPFVKEHFEQVMPYISQWCKSDDEHLRRLASEALRPRLPWGGHLEKFRQDPSPIFPILNQLRHDKSRYVQKSVANNINDISKDHPDIALALCRQWQKETSPECDWIIRHGLRSLVKQGHPEVFGLLGYMNKPKLKAVSLQLNNRDLVIGQTLQLQASLCSAADVPQKLVVDYRVHHQLGKGRTGTKVYKWKNIVLQQGEDLVLNKSQLFQQMSTRHYYSGMHCIDLLVNGEVVTSEAFNLLVD